MHGYACHSGDSALALLGRNKNLWCKKKKHRYASHTVKLRRKKFKTLQADQML